MHAPLQEAYLVGEHLQGFLQVQGWHCAYPATQYMIHACIAHALCCPAFDFIAVHILDMQHDRAQASTALDRELGDAPASLCRHVEQAPMPMSIVSTG